MQDPKSPHPSVLSPTSSSIFTEQERSKPIKIKLTSSSGAASPNGKWKDVAREIEADIRSHGNQSPPSSGLGSPVAKQLDPRNRQIYGKIPMDESPDLINCPNCNRPILRHAVKDHLDACTKEKPAPKKTTGGNSDKVNGAGKETNGDNTPAPTKNKKRKHEDGDSNANTETNEGSASETTPPKKKLSKREKEDGEGATKKEKKKKVKPAAPKQKLPVDVEKQCGVYDPEKGTRCARSLTCKSHSMSAKRAVPGRSQPYDTLLSLWQRKNQAKIAITQKPVQPVEAEDVDSEEEVRLVMEGVRKRYARPMEQKVVVGVRRKIRGLRMLEGFRGALLGTVQSMTGAGVGRGRRQSQVAEA